MSDTEKSFNLGRHEAQIEALSHEVHLLRGDVAEIKEFVASLKTGWKVGALMLTGLGSFVGAVVTFVLGLWRHS